MLKTIVFVKRREDISPEHFARYWVEAHGPLTSHLPGLQHLRFNILRPDLQRSPGIWDGVSCAWFSDDVTFADIGLSDAFNAMLEDEENFVDTTRRSPLVVNENFPLGAPSKVCADGRSAMVKTITGIRKKAGLELADFTRDWHTQHAQLITALPHMEAYTQNTINADVQRRGDYLFDAVAEVWWDSWQGVQEAVSSEAYKAVREDETRLVEPAGLTPLVVREIEIVRDSKLLV